MLKFKMLFILFFLFINIPLFAQSIDTTKTKADSTHRKAPTQSIIIKKKQPVLRPTMPLLPRLSEKKSRFRIDLDMTSQYRASHPEESTNYDALNKPYTKYNSPDQLKNIPMIIPVTPLNPDKKEPSLPLPSQDYILPTRSELDILEILWAKENVQDTTIYSCLDTTLNIYMEDLNRMLDRMVSKKLVRRKIVSPRNEFNLFGVLIEMSPSNIRNRVYEYHTNVDRELMRTFIEANHFLFNQDSSIADKRLYKVVNEDSTLLKDLNTKIYSPKE